MGDLVEPWAPGRASVERDLVLADGTRVHVRQIQSSDATELNLFHERLSPRSQRLRFFSVHPHLSPKELERFTTVDHQDREALVAEVNSRIIAVARFDREPGTDHAEVAFVVEDQWQGHGVGSLLLEHLASRARSVGVARFDADTLPENGPMLAVFRAHGGHNSFQDGVIHVSIPLDGQPA